MFKKNKKKESVNQIYADHFEEYLNKLQTAMWNLQDAVEEVLKKKDAVEVYPEGPDKEQAKQDLEKVKQSLICRVGYMDGRQQEAIDYYTAQFDKLEEFNYKHPNKYPTSHELIENEVKNYYHK